MEPLHGHAVDEVVGNGHGDDVGRQQRVALFLLHLLYLLVYIDFKSLLDDEHHQDDAHHSEGISGGVAHRHLLRNVVCLGVYLEHGLLRGTESRGVGDGAAHDAHHLPDGGFAVGSALYVEDADGQRHVEQHSRRGQHVELHATLFKRGEEAGPDLHAYGENEEYEAELAQEMQRVVLHHIAEVSHHDAHEQHEGDTERDAEDFDFTKIDTGEDNERVEQYRSCQRYVSGSQKF